MSMASDVERELLAEDSPEVARPPASIAPNAMNNEKAFQHFAEILDAKLDQKLASFKRSFDEREELHSSQLKKLKTESKASSSFKFKGNKIQYEFNVGILDSIDIVSKSLLEGNLTKANAELEKQKAEMEKRNKLIRFADKSPAGWTAVEEYESDELAADSEDAKKLRSAERRAISKIKLSKQAKKTGSTRSAFQNQPSNLQRLAPRFQTARDFQPFRQSFGQPFLGVRKPQPTDKCFRCLQLGHWAGSPVCQNRRGTENQYTTTSTSQN